MTYKSERGIALFCDGVADVPLITVENYMKWYSIYAIYPDGHVATVDTTMREDNEFERIFGESAYGDHVFNPWFVLYIAWLRGIEVCGSALEAIIGRWIMDHDNFPHALPEDFDPERHIAYRRHKHEMR